MTQNKNNTPESEKLENEVVNSEATENKTNESNAELNEVESIKQQLSNISEQLEKEKKEYLFLMAEFDNFRKRTIKEKGEIIRNASESAMKGILPIIDDFERGLDALKNTTDAEAVKEGMSLIYNKLIKYLEQNGVKAIESTGANFVRDML